MRRTRWISCGGGLALMLAVLAGGRSVLQGAEAFLRGDTDESGSLAVTDAIRILQFLFAGQGDAVHCQDAADVDDSGEVNVTDAVLLLSSLFRGAAAPPAPFPACGADPTEDALGCESFAGCVPSFQFFGLDFEGGAAFFVIDRSGSFQEQFRRAKEAAVQTISAFPDGQQVGVLFSDKGLVKWPASGEPATLDADVRASAIAFVSSIQGGGGSCDLPALLAALDFAGRSTANVRDIFNVSNGAGTCPGAEGEAQYLAKTLKEVTEANQGRAHLHAILPGSSNPISSDFMRDLAEQNGGTFHELP